MICSFNSLQVQFNDAPGVEGPCNQADAGFPIKWAAEFAGHVRMNLSALRTIVVEGRDGLGLLLLLTFKRSDDALIISTYLFNP